MSLVIFIQVLEVCDRGIGTALDMSFMKESLGAYTTKSSFILRRSVPAGEKTVETSDDEDDAVTEPDSARGEVGT